MPSRKEVIQARLRELRIDMVTRRLRAGEINSLHKVLDAREVLESVAGGKHQRRTGLIVATSTRLMFVERVNTSLSVEYEEVVSINFMSGHIMGRILLKVRQPVSSGVMDAPVLELEFTDVLVARGKHLTDFVTNRCGL